jgi:hypothetical protein
MAVVPKLRILDHWKHAEVTHLFLVMCVMAQQSNKGIKACDVSAKQEVCRLLLKEGGLMKPRKQLVCRALLRTM